jgi:hypothetical protein
MKYRIYIDEVGSSDMNATLEPVNRYLSLTGVVVDLQHIKDVITPDMEAIKNRFFHQHPDDPIIFHRKEVMNKKFPFQVLKNPDTENEFNAAFLECLDRWSYKVITVVIDKYEQKQRYNIWRYDPYHYAMSIIFERYHLRLKEIKQKGDMMFESRGGKEDTRLKESYRNIFKSGTDYIKPEDIDETLTSKELKIKPKSANIAGLQLADLLAFPAQRYALKRFNLLNDGRNTFNEKIIEVIEPKFFKRNNNIEGYGIKLLP